MSTAVPLSTYPSIISLWCAACIGDDDDDDGNSVFHASTKV